MIRKKTHKQQRILVLLFCMMAVMVSLSGQPRFSNSRDISIEQGVEGLEVYKIFIDKENRIWIKTDLALNVYDGYAVEVLRKGENATNIHSANEITAFVDSDDFLDIYYEDEVAFFDRWYKKTHLVDSMSIETMSQQDTIIQFVLSSTNELWWIQKNEKEYSFFNSKTQVIINSPYLQRTGDFTIQKISVGKTGFWLMDKDNNTYFFSYSDPQNQVKYLSPTTLISYEKTIKQLDNVLQEDSLGGLWVSYPGKIGMYYKGIEEQNLSKVDNLPDDGLYVFMWQDKKGRILYGLSNSFRFVDKFYIRSEKGKIIHWKELSEFTDIPTQVYSTDFYDYLFLASYRGLQVLEYARPFIGIHLDEKMPHQQGKYGNIIRGGVESDDGSLYIMEDHDSWFKEVDNRFKEIIFEKDGVSHYYVKYAPETNRIYALTRKEVIGEGGLRELAPPLLLDINPATDTFAYVNIGAVIHNYAIAPANQLFLGYKDSLGNYQLGDYNVKTKELQHVLGLKKEKNLYVKEITYDKKNNGIWVLYKYAGLYFIDLNQKERKLKFITLRVGKERVRYTNLYLGKNNDLWVCTANGVILLDTDSHQVKRKIDKRDGLKSEFICGVIVRDSFVWMATFYGLYAYDLSSNSLISIFEKDGIPMSEFNGKAVMERIDGRLFFGSANGLVSIDPEKFSVYGKGFNVYLRQVSYENKKGNREILYSNSAEAIEIQYSKQQVLKVIMGNSFWGDPSGASYQYFIEGIDNEWKKLQGNNVVEYNRLPIGDYTLRIKGISPIGIHSQNELVLKIAVVAPFYQKTSFKVLLVSALIGLFIFFITKGYYKTRERQKNVQLRNEKRISQLELMALQAQMNPHFIFNAINAIQECLWKNNKEFVEKHLNDFAKLTRLYLESSKVKTISLEQEIELLHLYTALEKLRFQDKIDININVSPMLEPRYFKIPSMMVQPFVENAINHGLFHKEGKGTLNISIVEKDEKVHILIEDNGIGRTAAKTIKKASLNNYKSRALQITEERVEVLKIHENITIDIKIEDLFDENKKGIGTKVEIIIPQMF